MAWKKNNSVRVCQGGLKSPNNQAKNVYSYLSVEERKSTQINTRSCDDDMKKSHRGAVSRFFACHDAQLSQISNFVSKLSKTKVQKLQPETLWLLLAGTSSCTRLKGETLPWRAGTRLLLCACPQWMGIDKQRDCKMRFRQTWAEKMRRTRQGMYLNYPVNPLELHRHTYYRGGPRG